MSEPSVNLEEKEKATIEDTYLEVLATQASRVPLPVLFVGMIIASMAANYYPAPVWGTWLAAVVVVLHIRWKVLSRLPRQTHIPIKKRINIAITLSLVNGILHASSTLFFPEFGIAERTILTLMLAGLMTGSVATTTGHSKTFLAFSFPIIIALTIVWALYPPPGATIFMRIGTPLLVLLLGFVLEGLARQYAAFFTESFQIRLEQKKLNAQLKEALKEAVAANQAKTRFLASASHDLRQPIHALSLFSAALSMRQLDEKTREIVSHMETAINNLAEHMSALLDMSKLEAGLVDVNMAELDLQAYLDQLHAEYLPQAQEKGLNLELKGNQPAWILTDKELFDRIVRNLMSNAIRYTDKGEIVIDLESFGNSWILNIRDSGRGIATEEQSLIFEEFYQADNPHRERSQGLGLGLSIVRRLADMLNIRIGLESEKGMGTIFSLAVPKQSHQVKSGHRSLEPLSISGCNVLCIDDEEEVRIALETILTQMGCVVRTVAGTDDAAEAARQQKPDIIIADFRLAHEDDGLSAINAIRDIHPAIPALLITGDTAPDRLNLISESEIPVLHKPIKADVLATWINKQLVTGESEVNVERNTS